MKSNILFFALCMLISLSSCTDKKNDTVISCDLNFTCDIEGSWTVTSLLEDGEELMGEDVEFLTIIFESSNRFKWSGGLFDENLLLHGDYEVTNCNKLEAYFDPNEEDFSFINFDLELSEENLSLVGSMDDERYIIKATRN